MECFTAFSCSLEIECPSDKFPDRIVIKGCGQIIKRSNNKPKIMDNGKFILTVWDNGPGRDNFHMIIIADDKEELNHDSGIVSIIGSDLIIQDCIHC
jgi:hypothetical protein